MPEVPHDQTVTLRLELGRERDRANALEAALRKEILNIIRAEINEAVAQAVSEGVVDQTEYNYMSEDFTALHNKFANLEQQYLKLKSDYENILQENTALRIRAINDPVIRQALLDVVRNRAVEGEANK